MFYKVIKNNRVIDVLDQLIYMKYQPKHGVMVLCNESEAQAILSSDKQSIWHEVTLYRIPVEAGYYDSVKLEPIDQFEYKKLKMLNLQSPEQIIDCFVMSLVEEGII